MKKNIIGLIVLAGLTVASFANAQLFPYTGTNLSSTLGTSQNSIQTTTAMMGTSSTSSVSSSSSLLPTPVVTLPTTTQVVGYVQFNGLVVDSVSGIVTPATILVTTQPAATCSSFVSQLSITGTSIACPSNSQLTIQVSDATQLLLSDRTSGVLGNITTGDTVNIFGYYDGAGTVQANVIRDISKPVAGMASSTSSVTSSPTPSITSIQSQIAEIQILLNQLVQEVNTLMSRSN